MRIHASRTLLATPHPEGWLVYNFLTKSAVLCSPEAVACLQRLGDGAVGDDLALPGGEAERLLVDSLVENDLALIEGSEASAREDEFLRKWKWGMAAAALHCATLNCDFMSLDEQAEAQATLRKAGSQPDLLRRHAAAATALPRPGSTLESADLLPTMLRRRTNRVAAPVPLSLQQLSDCLYAGLAITGSVETPSGPLPLAITPSGGARNPYEAYVYVAAVADLAPGFYHYSGYDHSLELIRGGAEAEPERMLAGQDWAAAMPAIILLVAHLERPMWKYQDANAYRVMLIEAGHIGQNIMLAATAHGLSACPTAALHHDTVCRNLGLTDVLHVPVYALTLSLPGAAPEGEMRVVL